MNTQLQETQGLPLEQGRELTERAQRVWSSGDFARMGVRNVLAGELLCLAVDVHPGESVLDVAAGSGNTAIAAARRGGRVTATDFVSPLLEVAAARAQLPSPFQWGTEDGLHELFGSRVSAVRVERRTIDMCAESAERAVEFNRTWFGPTRTVIAQLDEAAADRFAAELAAELKRFNRATDGSLLAPAVYLEVVAVRS